MLHAETLSVAIYCHVAMPVSMWSQEMPLTYCFSFPPSFGYATIKRSFIRRFASNLNCSTLVMVELWGLVYGLRLESTVVNELPLERNIQENPSSILDGNN